MKAFGKTVGKTVVFCLVMMLMCSFVYPLALTGVSQLTMKAKADGAPRSGRCSPSPPDGGG